MSGAAILRCDFRATNRGVVCRRSGGTTPGQPRLAGRFVLAPALLGIHGMTWPFRLLLCATWLLPGGFALAAALVVWHRRSSRTQVAKATLPTQPGARLSSMVHEVTR